MKIELTKEEAELLGQALSALMERTLTFIDQIDNALRTGKRVREADKMGMLDCDGEDERLNNARKKCVEHQDAVAKLQVKLINERLGTR